MLLFDLIDDAGKGNGASRELFRCLTLDETNGDERRLDSIALESKGVEFRSKENDEGNTWSCSTEEGLSVEAIYSFVSNEWTSENLFLRSAQLRNEFDDGNQCH